MLLVSRQDPGINTGEVVVRSIRKDDLHTDYVPVGHSTNLAARMCAMRLSRSSVRIPK
jgi:class 3 adenylate cyclase